MENVTKTSVVSPADPQKGGKPFYLRLLHFIGRYVLPLALSVWLIFWFFDKINLHQVLGLIENGCRLWPILVMMGFVVTGMAFRGIRWGIQLRGVGVKRMPPLVECCTIFGAYAFNMLFPRLGEAWRCVFVSKRQKSSFMTVVGTDLGDRAADLICVVVFVGLALLLAHSQMSEFFDKYALGRFILNNVGDVWVWALVVLVVGGVWALIRFLPHVKWVAALKNGIVNAWNGFYILFHLPQLGLYLWLTLGIWVSYFLQVYICFFAFPFSMRLAGAEFAYGLLPGLMCLVFGSCSTIVPSNGGLGPWTIAVAYAVELYGLDSTHAAAFALACWGFEAFITIIMGLFAAVYLSLSRRKGTD